ncbi:fluoride efflux transporter FluC [Pseudonocardia spirodelae]|uniref:Fluoride-specific ion channel FluC n=1 Tax=Pseudonocardia spirodelae TaxID=3133431 RepID=A0ABU8T8V0_9PSEU
MSAAPGRGPTLAVIAAGGVVGAEARWALGLAGPPAPWTTLTINVTGCLLMGVLMVLVTERYAAHPLVRPALGVGVLGGYTTFSTYAVDVATPAFGSPASIALMAATPVLALAATAAGAASTRALTRTPGGGGAR